jgi:hypothetical protein
MAAVYRRASALPSLKLDAAFPLAGLMGSGERPLCRNPPNKKQKRGRQLGGLRATKIPTALLRPHIGGWF